MKFRNPETGEFYINAKYDSSFCGKYRDKPCGDCPIGKVKNGLNCTDWIEKNPEESARLMGYEVVYDEPKADSGKPTRESILEEAKRCVCNQREKEYGSAEKNFMLIASLWEHYIREKCVSDGVDVNIFPEDVAMMMALLKIARIGTGVGTMDSFVDLAGYAALGGEIARGEK